MRTTEEILEDMLGEQRITNALLRVSSGGSLQGLLDVLSEDAVDAAIVRTLADGKRAASVLAEQVSKSTGARPRTIQDHLAQLIQQGIVQRRGAGPSTEYELTPLFNSAQLSAFQRRQASRARRE